MKKNEAKILYVIIKESTNEAFIEREVTSLSELIGVDRSTIYRKFEKEGNFWIKNGYKVYKTINFNIKSRRGG